MADVFEARGDLAPQRERLWTLIGNTPMLDWLLLTKRPELISSLVPWGDNWPENIWVGTTIESQEWVSRAARLADIPAKVRFLSCEPLLGPVDLSPWIEKIHWVIVGGESGGRARPVELAWVDSIFQQTRNTPAVFHFKQWGEWAPSDMGGAKRVGKRIAGREFMGRTWDGFPTIQRETRTVSLIYQDVQYAHRPAT
jgi:protein gp37